MKNITLGITGASGMPFALKLIKELINNNIQVNLIITKAGLITLNQEVNINLVANPKLIKQSLFSYLELEDEIKLLVYSNEDWFAPMASGSNVSDAMVVCPCSMATLGKIANGIGEDLLSRSADVILKERKNLIIVPRETPLSVIHLKNMLNLAKLGVCILPPVPAFYTHPQSIEDIIDFVVARILDQLGIYNQLIKRWNK